MDLFEDLEEESAESLDFLKVLEEASRQLHEDELAHIRRMASDPSTRPILKRSIDLRVNRDDFI